jgi:hypothetical protein
MPETGFLLAYGLRMPFLSILGCNAFYGTAQA